MSLGSSPRPSPRAGRSTSCTDGSEIWRSCRLGDITILVPARTSLPFLEDALEAAHPLPGRVELTRLCQPRGARRAHGPARRRRPHRSPAHRERPAHAPPRLRRRRPVPPQGPRRPRLVVQHAGSARSRPWRRVGRPGLPPGDPRSSSLAIARRAARPHRARSAFSSWLRRGTSRNTWRRSPVRDRPGPCLDRRHRRQSAGLPPVGRSADVEAQAESVLPETDDDAVRIMTIHVPRARVPHHDRERPLPDPAATEPGRGALRKTWPGRLSHGQGRHHRGVRGRRPDRRADGLRRAAPSALRRLHGRATTRALIAPGRPQESSRQEAQPHQQAGPPPRHGCAFLDDLPDLSGEPTPLTTDPAVRRRRQHRSPQWHEERAALLAHKDPGRWPPPPSPTKPSPIEVPTQSDAGLQKRPRDLDLPPWLKVATAPP